jgi:hypothetical protein
VTAMPSGGLVAIVVEVRVMSLSAREQQALNSIEVRLADSDPKLASLLATFTRLVSGEKMPVREKIRAAWWGTPHRGPNSRHLGGDIARRPAPRLRRSASWRRAMLAVGVAVTMVLAAVALVVNRGGGKGACRESLVVACAGRAPGHGSRPAADNPAAGQGQRPEDINQAWSHPPPG